MCRSTFQKGPADGGRRRSVRVSITVFQGERKAWGEGTRGLFKPRRPHLADHRRLRGGRKRTFRNNYTGRIWPDITTGADGDGPGLCRRRGRVVSVRIRMCGKAPSRTLWWAACTRERMCHSGVCPSEWVGKTDGNSDGGKRTKGGWKPAGCSRTPAGDRAGRKHSADTLCGWFRRPEASSRWQKPEAAETRLGEELGPSAATGGVGWPCRLNPHSIVDRDKLVPILPDSSPGRASTRIRAQAPPAEGEG